MIDFIIVDDWLGSKIVDTREYRGVKVGTYYFLVIYRIKALCQRWQHHAKIVTTELERIKVERWNNYFESVIACEDTVADDNVTATEYMIDDGNESETTTKEFLKALKRKKSQMVFYIFVDLEKAYDRVKTNDVRKTLSMHGTNIINHEDARGQMVIAGNDITDITALQRYLLTEIAQRSLGGRGADAAIRPLHIFKLLYVTVTVKREIADDTQTPPARPRPSDPPTSRIPSAVAAVMI
ncbi:hypothetical protein EVAR_12463_1 [Eumeta japonica]|uniref:Uncharacterized protein n=1 Tax=Eumeta variegata TaxID=151549 RepID=A0A4C1TPI5_EUMVA|nr:hypothetical protein EVAR_12463_1 [Eumeta japonica]